MSVAAWLWGAPIHSGLCRHSEGGYVSASSSRRWLGQAAAVCSLGLLVAAVAVLLLPALLSPSSAATPAPVFSNT